MARVPERTAVLVIRAWLEGENEARALRARITSMLDVAIPEVRETLVAASEAEIVNAVSAWIRAFAAGR